MLDEVILQGTLTGEVSLEEVEQLAVALGDHIDGSERALVHVMLDLTAASALPTSVKDVAEASRPFMGHDRLGWVVVYGADDQMLQYMTSTVAKMYSSRFTLADDRAAALHHLSRVDATLPDLDNLPEA